MAGKIRECASCGYRVADSDTSCPRCGHTAFSVRRPPPPPIPPPAPPPRGPRPPPAVPLRRPSPAPAGLAIQVFFFAGLVAGVLAAVLGGLLGSVLGTLIAYGVGAVCASLPWTTWENYAQVWLHLIWLLAVWITIIIVSLCFSRYFIERIASGSGMSGWVLARRFRPAWLIPLAILWAGIFLSFAPDEWTRFAKANSTEARQSNELVKSGEKYLEAARENSANAAKAVESLIEALRIWPGNQKAQKEIRTTVEALLAMANQAFNEGDLLRARDLFVQAKKISGNPQGVESAENRLYRYLEVRAPTDGWSAAVPIDTMHSIEIHSDTPVRVQGDSEAFLISRSQEDDIKISSGSIQLQSAGGRASSVKVFTLQTTNQKHNFPNVILNPLARPHARVRFFIGWEPPPVPAVPERPAKPSGSPANHSSPTPEPFLPQEFSLYPPPPFSSPVPTPIPVQKASPQVEPQVISVPSLAKFAGRPVRNLWLYGTFSLQNVNRSSAQFKTVAYVGLPQEGSTELIIEFEGGVQVSQRTWDVINRRGGIVSIEIKKSNPIEILGIVKTSKKSLLIRARSKGRLEL